MQRSVSAIILAGGRGRRVGNQDKGLLQWQHRALIEWVIDAIAPQVDDIVISCNRNSARYQLLANRVCEDDLVDFQGPLAGVKAALSMCLHDLVFICPCDMPQLPENVVAQLYQQKMATNADVVYASDGQYQQYLVALLNKSLQTSLNNYLNGPQRSVKGWYATLHTEIVDFGHHAAAFTHFNTLTPQ